MFFNSKMNDVTTNQESHKSRKQKNQRMEKVGPNTVTEPRRARSEKQQLELKSGF